MPIRNLPLWLAMAILGWFGWMIMDMSSPVSSAQAGASMAVVTTSKVPVLVEFYADWCGPCKQVGPVVEALADELADKARVIRINVDQQPDLAAENGIRGIPTFIAYKAGHEVRRESGAIPKAVMLEMLGL